MEEYKSVIKKIGQLCFIYTSSKVHAFRLAFSVMFLIWHIEIIASSISIFIFSKCRGEQVLAMIDTLLYSLPKVACTKLVSIFNSHMRITAFYHYISPQLGRYIKLCILVSQKYSPYRKTVGWFRNPLSATNQTHPNFPTRKTLSI